MPIPEPRPKVSVCISTYNHEPYISQAIDSVLMQETDFDVEIIIGEDDSKDRTREIVREYKEKYPDKIRLFLNDRSNVIYIDGRPTGRWNFLNNLKHARGEYVALLDGDDYWTDPRKLEKQVKLLDASPHLALCFTACIFSYEDGEAEDEEYRPKEERDVFQLEDIILNNPIAACTVMFKRGLLKGIPSFLWKTPVADWPLYTVLARHGAIGYISDVTAVRRVHGEGVWSKLSYEGKLRISIKTREVVYGSLSTPNKRLCSEFLLTKKEKLMHRLIQSGDYAEVRRLARSCLKHAIHTSRNKHHVKKLISYTVYMSRPHRFYLWCRRAH